MKKNTQELMELLKNAKDINSYLTDYSQQFTAMPVAEYLKRLLKDKNLKKSQCIADADLQRNYGYQIFSGERIPSRNKVLSLCFAMHLTPEEAHAFLCSTGYPDLYPKNKRDSILIFALTKQLSLRETNDLLYGLKEDIL